MVAAWIGVGDSYPTSRKVCTTASLRPRSAKETGAGESTDSMGKTGRVWRPSVPAWLASRMTGGSGAAAEGLGILISCGGQNCRSSAEPASESRDTLRLIWAALTRNGTNSEILSRQQQYALRLPRREYLQPLVVLLNIAPDEMLLRPRRILPSVGWQFVVRIEPVPPIRWPYAVVRRHEMI